jgi:hypothetical protein
MEPEVTTAPLQATESLTHRDEAQPAGPSERNTKGDDTTGTEKAADEGAAGESYVYITGFKLTAVMSSVTAVVFMLLLDISIISTVS